MTTNPNHAEALLESLAEPLRERCRRGRPGLSFAFHPGDALDPFWRNALTRWVRKRGLYVEHLALSDLGGNPKKTLLGRRRVRDHLFTIQIRAGDLPSDPSVFSPVVALNLHRDTFRDENLCILFFIPVKESRRFLDLASNLYDYRTSEIELPSRPPSGAPVRRLASKETETPHNLPFPSLGLRFLGREDEMQNLETLLAESGCGVIADPMAQEGMGGIGKTRLAIEYAWRHLQNYDAVWFVRADTPGTLRSGIAQLAQTDFLNLPVSSASSEETRMNAVLDWFRATPKWLLVIDNADSEVSANVFENEILPALASGHVLLTSRFRRWGGAIQSLLLHTLSIERAADFLLEQTRNSRRTDPADREHALDLARLVNGLPLALEQLAAWTRREDASLGGVLETLRAETAKPLRWFDERALRYPRSIAAVWARTLEHCTEHERLLLRFFAWLAPEPVPVYLLEAASQTSRDKPGFLKIVRDLALRSVLKQTKTGAFQLHRLFGELERRRTPGNERAEWNGRIAKALAACMTDDPSDVRSRPRLSLLRPHAEELFRRAENPRNPAVPLFLRPSMRPRLSRLLNYCGRYFQGMALHAKAERLFRRALAVDEAASGPSHPDVARDCHNLAALLRDTNRLKEAEALYRRALAVFEAAFGPDDPKVATACNNLAELLRATDRLEEAEPLYRRALSIYEAAFGPDNPNVAAACNNLAGILQDTHRLEEAEPLYRRALAVFEAAFGPNHPNAATACNNLALLLQAASRLEEAEPLFRRSLAINENTFGPDHPNTATSCSNLAELLAATNRLEEAEPLFRRCLRILLQFTQRAAGQEHPHLSPAIGNYRDILRKMQQPEQERTEKLLSLGPEAGADPEVWQRLFKGGEGTHG